MPLAMTGARASGNPGGPAPAALHDEALPPRYLRLLAVWIALGVPAAIALLVVFFLMVAKPS